MDLLKKMKKLLVISMFTLVLYGFDSQDISNLIPLVDKPIIGGHHIIKGY